MGLFLLWIHFLTSPMLLDLGTLLRAVAALMVVHGKFLAWSDMTDFPQPFIVT